VDFAKKNPKETFLEEVSGGKGQFHFVKGQNNDLYIFVYDLEGKVLAHGVRRELVGVNRWASKDPDGKPWIQDWTKLVKEKGSGWIEYKELNPAQGNKVMKKVSFVELYNGMVLGAGIYE
jgi:signal transduction histidine kinase